MRSNPTRRRLLQATAAGVGTGMAGCQELSDLGPTESNEHEPIKPAGAWPMYAGDAANTGRTDESGPSDPEVDWRFEATNSIYDGVAVADGRVFAGAQDGNLYAVNAADGSELWRFPVRGGARQTPAVAGGLVVIGGDRGGLYAVDAETGTQQWAILRLKDVPTNPAIHDERVYVGGFDGRVYAIDAATGTIAWTADTGGERATGPAVADGTVYVGWHTSSGPGQDSGGLAAFSTDGEREWRIDPGSVRYPPAVVDGVVYTSTEVGGTHAFDASDGTERWRYEPASTGGTPTVAHGRVYVGASDSYFYALDADTGEQVWEATPGKWPQYSAVAGDDVVYLCSWATRVYAVDAATGETRWVRSMENPMSDPVVVDGTVYVAPDNAVVALRDP